MDEANKELALAVTIIRPACAGEPDLLERIKKAMREAKDYWMSNSDEFKFRAAIGAALVETPQDSPDYQRIISNFHVLRNINAMIQGIPINIEDALAELEGAEPIPLVAMWREITGEKARQSPPRAGAT